MSIKSWSSNPILQVLKCASVTDDYLVQLLHVPGVLVRLSFTEALVTDNHLRPPHNSIYHRLWIDAGSAALVIEDLPRL